MLGHEVHEDHMSGANGVPAVVKKAVLRGIERDGYITPATEAQVQRAVDLLRLENRGDAALRQIEAISCTLRTMHQTLLQGRVNAYASTLLRLRKSVEAL